MRKKVLQLVVLLLAIGQMQVFAQDARVTGKVVGPDNNPVSGASVTISGSDRGTVTDANGDFAISAPSDATLVVSYLGYADQIIALEGRSQVNVSLLSGQSAGLEEVVVTGYTAQKKKDIIGSVSVVDVKQVKAVPSSSALSALQGQASGVTIINNGSPGAPSALFIRGVSGGNNTPLVLIDGVQGNINDVPAQDVESIQVLKDAGAAAIYGARGGNGVIVITTRKGKSGVPRVSYESFFNYQIPRSVDKLGLLTTEQYADIWYELNPNSALFPGGDIPDFIYNGAGTRGVANAGDPAVDPARYRFTPKGGATNYLIAPFGPGGSHFYDQIMDPALMMNHNITASGGSERATYLLSLGYLNHQGTLKNTFMERYNVRVNSTFKLTNFLTVGENMNVFYRKAPNATPVNGGFGPINGAITTPPFIPTLDIMGNYAGTYLGPAGEVGDWGNPLADVENVGNNRRREYGIQGNIFAELTFLKNFKARTSFGGTIDNSYRQQYFYREYFRRGGTGVDQLTESSFYASLWQWTNTLQYANTFGKHDVSALVGYEAIEQNRRTLSATGQDFFSPNYNYITLNTAVTRQQPTSTPDGNNLASLFGKVDYQYDEKYLLGVSARRDGYSHFGSESKYGNFYSVGLGWRLSQEAFMRNVAWISDLKIRGSYGELGNKENVRYGNAYSTFAQNPFYSYYDISGAGNTLATGFYSSTYGNPFTSWETNIISNIGFDASLFNNRLDFSIEYYKRDVEGLLFQAQLPATAGEGRAPFVNVGDIRNTGVDINATYRARIGDDFNFSIGANFTTYKNEVIDIPGTAGYVDAGIQRLEEGYPLGSFFGYKVLGVFRDQKDVDDHATQQDAEPGRFKYLDANGDGEITNDDRVHYGDPNPDFSLGLNLGATYKNFDFSAMFYAAQGQDVYNNLLQWTGSFERGVSNKTKVVLDAWSESNPDGSWKKNELARNFSNSGANNSAFLEDGSFIRLRNVQVGYNFSASTLRNIGISNLRLYVGGTNLFLITNYSGLDPEIPQGYGGGQIAGVDDGAYSQQAGVVLGLNINF